MYTGGHGVAEEQNGMDNITFIHGGDTYSQVKGLIIGASLSPVIVGILLEETSNGP